MLIYCVLVGQQVHGGCLVGIEVPPPADTLGSLAFVAEGVLDDAYSSEARCKQLGKLASRDAVGFGEMVSCVPSGPVFKTLFEHVL